MLFSFRYPIIRLSVFLIIGICLARFVSLPLSFYGGALLIAASFLFILIKVRMIQHLSTVLVYFIVLLFGAFIWNIQLPKNNPNHYDNCKLYQKQRIIKGQVTDEFKHYGNKRYYQVTLNSVDSLTVDGKIRLVVDKGVSKHNRLTVGNHICFVGEIEMLKKQVHPSQFDYVTYLSAKGIYAQVNVIQDEVLIRENSLVNWLRWRIQFKNKLVHRLKDLGFDPSQLDLIKALFLGDKTQMGADLKSAYIQSGVVHILAISGLHIGIVLLFLQFILSPLQRIANGRIYKIVLILICLWLIAFITGFSVSVVRSVTMFSFLSIAMETKRVYNIYNALFGSMFILLISRPQFLFDIGFQLSYTAVLSIVLIQPVFKLNVKNKLLQYPIDLITVSLVAQIGILPLSLYYFHQFSGLFLLGNLMLIPVLSILLCVGVPGLILLYYMDLSFVVYCFQFLLNLLNKGAVYLSFYSQWVVKDIYFSFAMLVLSYVVLVFMLMSYYQKKLLFVIYSLAGVIVFQLYYGYNQGLSKNELIVFNKYKETLLVSNINGNIVSYQDNLLAQDRIVSQYLSSTIHHAFKKEELNNYFVKNTIKIVLIDSSGIYDKRIQPDVVLMTGAAKINFERMLQDLHPKEVIADGSNYRSDVSKWKYTCSQKNIPFQSTEEKGYCVIK